MEDSQNNTHLKVVTKRSDLKHQLVEILSFNGVESCRCNDGVIAKIDDLDTVKKTIQESYYDKLKALQIVFI